MSTIHEDMQSVAIRVLEEWAMMLVEPADGWQEVFDMQKPFFAGRLEFRGIVSGTYSVICQEAFARNLTANLLGEETGADGGMAQYSDALREMVNVLSGNLLTACYGEDTVFDLSSPHAEQLAFADLQDLLQGYCLTYMADDQPVVITFTPERVTEHGN